MAYGDTEEKLIPSSSTRKQSLSQRISEAEAEIDSQHSENSSFCDEPIQVSDSEGSATQDKNAYQVISNVSTAPVEKKQKGLSQKPSFPPEKKHDNALIDVKNQGFSVLRKLKSYLQFNREFLEDRQVYRQIFFDSLAIFYLYRKRISLKKQRIQSLKDEQQVIDFQTKLLTDPVQFYEKAIVGKRVIVRGEIRSEAAKNFLQKRIDKDEDSFVAPPISTFQLYNKDKKEVPIIFTEDTSVKTSSTLSNPSNKKGLITAVASGIVSIFSGNIFKFGVSSENGTNNFQVGYFFGEKTISQGREILSVRQVFKNFDLKQFQIEQRAFKVSAGITALFAGYFFAKMARNVIHLIIKKYKEISEQQSNQKE